MKGTHATLEKIKQYLDFFFDLLIFLLTTFISLSDIAIDSFFCCGGQSSHKGYSAVLRILV